MTWKSPTAVVRDGKLCDPWDPPESLPRSRWIPDESKRECTDCDTPFTVFNRRHHCRRCGFVFCNTCTAKKIKYSDMEEKERVCRLCRNLLVAASIAKERESKRRIIEDSRSSST